MAKGGKLKEAYTGSGGTVHPIRGSSGYSPKKAGESKKASSAKGGKKK